MYVCVCAYVYVCETESVCGSSSPLGADLPPIITLRVEGEVEERGEGGGARPQTHN